MNGRRNVIAGVLDRRLRSVLRVIMIILCGPVSSLARQNDRQSFFDRLLTSPAIEHPKICGFIRLALRPNPISITKLSWVSSEKKLNLKRKNTKKHH